jgi:hypothetical protein
VREQKQNRSTQTNWPKTTAECRALANPNISMPQFQDRESTAPHVLHKRCSLTEILTLFSYITTHETLSPCSPQHEQVATTCPVKFLIAKTWKPKHLSNSSNSENSLMKRIPLSILRWTQKKNDYQTTKRSKPPIQARKRLTFLAHHGRVIPLAARHQWQPPGDPYSRLSLEQVREDELSRGETGQMKFLVTKSI